jgi:phage shock protein C
MNTYDETTRVAGFYRDADRAVVGGVCAGLAGHFGLNLKVTRFLMIVAFLVATPFAFIAYLGAVLLIPAESRDGSRHSDAGRCCWGIRRTRRNDARRRARDGRSERMDRRKPRDRAAVRPSLEDVRNRYRQLDARLVELEKQVTSPRFQLEQEFRKL